MEQVKVLKTLQFFLALEKSQVKFYSIQSKWANDRDIQKGLLRLQAIEQSHVENISVMIEKIGGNPSLVTEAGKLGGLMLGETSGLAGDAAMLNLGASIEDKAISDYENFIKNINDPILQEVMENNKIDEELHAAWLREKANSLSKIRG